MHSFVIKRNLSTINTVISAQEQEGDVMEQAFTLYLIVAIIGGAILMATYERPDSVYCHRHYGCIERN